MLTQNPSALRYSFYYTPFAERDALLNNQTVVIDKIDHRLQSMIDFIDYDLSIYDRLGIIKVLQN